MRFALLLLYLGACYGSEITLDHFLSAIAKVETGVDRRSIGDVRGSWKVGSAGEVSCFQIGPAVLADLGISHKSGRIHRDPVYAESVARLWLARIMDGNGDWRVAAAKWNAGPRGYKSRQAKDYADRVMNIAQEYSK